MKVQRNTLSLEPGLNELPQLFDFRAWLAAEGAAVRIGGRTEPAPANARGRYLGEGTAVLLPMDWPTALGLAAEIVRTAQVAGVPLGHGELARIARAGRRHD